MSLRKPSQVSPTTGRLQSSSPGSAAATSASRTTPTECVFVSPIGVVSRPESRTHSSPVSSPLPLIRCAPAKSGSTGGTHDGDTGPNVLALDQRRVPDPNPGHVRDRVLRPGGEPADLDPEVAGAGLHSASLAAVSRVAAVVLGRRFSRSSVPPRAGSTARRRGCLPSPARGDCPPGNRTRIRPPRARR